MWGVRIAIAVAEEPGSTEQTAAAVTAPAEVAGEGADPEKAVCILFPPAPPEEVQAGWLVWF